MNDRWADMPGHLAWLRREELRLLDFGAAGVLAGGGFGHLDTTGSRAAGPAQTWITGRMAHVFAMAHARGVPGAGAHADHALEGLRTVLRDAEHGGWYTEAGPDGRPPSDGTKSAYNHAFVVLGAATATRAGCEGARPLLDEALETVLGRFIEPETGLGRESFDRAWTRTEGYRGANSNMHLVECFLAAAGATGDHAWNVRALRIADFVVHTAADNGWRLVEHFTVDWQPWFDYNADRVGDRFRPYGTTVGHWLEWARLLIELEHALGEDAPTWLLPAAEHLFDLSIEHGWAVDGPAGFVYTLDWEDRPVVRERMHWVPAEGVLAAAALSRRTGNERFESWYRLWWDHIAVHWVDRERGSWHHELSPSHRLSSTVWEGKPDLYHAYQAVVLPTLDGPPASSALSGGVLGGRS